MIPVYLTMKDYWELAELQGLLAVLRWRGKRFYTTQEADRLRRFSDWSIYCRFWRN